MTQIKKIFCKHLNSKGKLCNNFLGDAGPSVIFRSAPCKRCGNKTEIFDVSSDTASVLKFKFDKEPSRDKIKGR